MVTAMMVCVVQELASVTKVSEEKPVRCVKGGITVPTAQVGLFLWKWMFLLLVVVCIAVRCVMLFASPCITVCSCGREGRCDEGIEGSGQCVCLMGWKGDRCQINIGEFSSLAYSQNKEVGLISALLGTLPSSPAHRKRK